MTEAEKDIIIGWLEDPKCSEDLQNFLRADAFSALWLYLYNHRELGTNVKTFKRLLARMLLESGYTVERLISGVTKTASITSLFKNSDIEEAIIPECIIHIPINLFQDCSKLKKVVLPESCIGISGYAFDGCSSLEEITLPKSCNCICTKVFDRCPSLKKITILNDARLDLRGSPFTAGVKLTINYAGSKHDWLASIRYCEQDWSNITVNCLG